MTERATGDAIPKSGLKDKIMAYILHVTGDGNTRRFYLPVRNPGRLHRFHGVLAKCDGRTPGGLAFHPPFLYLGYVGFSIAFSFAMAALIEGRVEPVWARWVRPWTHFPILH